MYLDTVQTRQISYTQQPLQGKPLKPAENKCTD